MDNYQITLPNGKYEIIDVLNNVTIPDCIVFNKIGTGHGEKKLYVGSVNNPVTLEFFDDFDRDCFFLKRDLYKFMQDIQPEVMNPQQNYANPSKLISFYQKVQEALDNINGEVVPFRVYRVEVRPPRIYINSYSENWDLFRKVALPNISYISFIKLRGQSGHIYYYCRPFLDYRNDIVKYESPFEVEEQKKIEASDKNEKEKGNLIKARKGQGLYRQRLLEECPFCPISMINDERLLIASHIKPWAKSNDKEKIDPKNGLALSPNFDCLFDNGFMTFTIDKKIIVSPWISPMNQKRLGIYTGMKVPKLPLDSAREKYMEYHRQHIYKG